MKNLIIISACLYQGEHQAVDTKLENVDNHVAAELIATGRAREITIPHEVIGNRDPVVENRDPATAPAPGAKPGKTATKKAKGGDAADTPPPEGAPEGGDNQTAE